MSLNNEHEDFALDIPCYKDSCLHIEEIVYVYVGMIGPCTRVLRPRSAHGPIWSDALAIWANGRQTRDCHSSFGV